MIKEGQYSAATLLKMLAGKHSKDVFVPECKDGPTHAASHLRMDAWTMARSWAHPCTVAYEIKTSRADFLKDNKWPGYLPYCNQFYFVAPKNLIAVAELPETAGLLAAVGQGEGRRLLTQKKAPWRDVQIPESVYRYILMCRTEVQDERDHESAAEYWRNWLEKKRNEQQLGYRVARRIRERADEFATENIKLKAEIRNYDAVRATLAEMGLDGSFLPWDMERRLRDSQRVFDKDLIGRMTEARDALGRALVSAASLEEENADIEAGVVGGERRV